MAEIAQSREGVRGVHSTGEGAAGNKALGEFDMREWANGVAAALRAIKADRVSLELQNEFFKGSLQPLKTPQ